LDEAKKQVGTIVVLLNLPEARVTIDGVAVDKNDLPFELFVDPGAHTIVAQRDGFVDAHATIDAHAGAAQEVPLVLHRSVVPGAALAGGAGAALVTGVVLEVVAASQRSSATSVGASIQAEHHTCVLGAINYDARCVDLANTAHSSDTLHDAGIGVLVIAGAAALGS